MDAVVAMGEGKLLNFACAFEMISFRSGRASSTIWDGQNLQDLRPLPTLTFAPVRLLMKVLLPTPVTPITAMKTGFFPPWLHFGCSSASLAASFSFVKDSGRGALIRVLLAV